MIDQDADALTPVLDRPRVMIGADQCTVTRLEGNDEPFTGIDITSATTKTRLQCAQNPSGDFERALAAVPRAK